jgi:hypothetical protein
MVEGKGSMVDAFLMSDSLYAVLERTTDESEWWCFHQRRVSETTSAELSWLGAVLSVEVAPGERKLPCFHWLWGSLGLLLDFPGCWKRAARPALSGAPQFAIQSLAAGRHRQIRLLDDGSGLMRAVQLSTCTCIKLGADLTTSTEKVRSMYYYYRYSSTIASPCPTKQTSGSVMPVLITAQ